MDKLIQNRKCAKEVLDNNEYDIDEENINNPTPIFMAHKQGIPQRTEMSSLKISVQCRPPYDKFESCEKGARIKSQEVKEELNRLNNELLKCIQLQQ